MKKAIFLCLATLMLAGCEKETPYVPQPPTALIVNVPDDGLLGRGESLTLRAEETDEAIPTTYAWSVDGTPVESATGRSFIFSSGIVGEHRVKLTATNADGEATDEVAITVHHLISFENERVVDYLAGPSSYGENLYSTYTGEEGQYYGYDDEPTGLLMMINDPFETGEYDFWSGGVAISRWNEMSTGDYTNQCSVFYQDPVTGMGGYDGSPTFAVGYGFNGLVLGDTRATIFMADETQTFAPLYFWVNNTTYTALAMMNGDAVSKPFTHADGDWLKLVVNAYDVAGNDTGTPVEFYLADFRTASSPGIVTQWSKVDLTPLGNQAHTLKFDLRSSDNGSYGMNTPSYFCFDNLALMK